MTSIPKEGAELDHEFDIDDQQLDIFGPTPAEIAAAQKAKREAEERAKALANESPEDKRRREWRERWEAGKATRDQPIDRSAVELAEYKRLHQEAAAELARARQTIREQNTEIAALKGSIAEISKGEEITLRGRHYQATIEVQVKPRMIVTLDVDDNSMHGRPHTYELAITKTGNAYVRATERGDGTFDKVANAGPIMVRVTAVRELATEPDEPSSRP